MRYPITKGNLLENPEGYSYSDYLGKTFLHSFFYYRNTVMNFAKDKTGVDKEFNTSKSIEDEIKSYVSKITISEDFNESGLDTKLELTKIFNSIISDDFTIESKRLLDIFVYKYEVFKKLYEGYLDLESPDKSKRIADYTNISIYVLLSFLCLVSYRRSCNLKYINTSLKINDMICSVKDKLENEELYGLYLLINYELDAIESLMLRNGTKFEIN